MQSIIGRQAEIDLLQKILASKQAEFLAVYGRRRVGKTYLITEFYGNKGIFLEVTGIREGDQKTQIRIFKKELKRVFPSYATPSIVTDWLDAFADLHQQIEAIPLDQKIILFFDELPWIATPKSNFLAALDHYWNRFFSRMPNIILIVCGSAASWMIDHVISDTGGLYGRLTQKLRLEPFTLAETEQYLQFKNIMLDRKQIIELYMAMGGIPKYLNQIRSGQSSVQIINQQFFSATGYLNGEFNHLYSSLFNNYEKHIAVVRVLAKNPFGLTRNELLDTSKIGSGGTASKILRELEESGFISKINFYETKKSLAKYRLIDQFSLFYLRWVENIEKNRYVASHENYWLQQINSHAWQIWAGYAFENICLLHLSKIIFALGISGIQVNAYVWYTKGNTTSKSGAQIDLLLDRADKCINLCEIKFYNQQLTLTKKHIEELQAKKEAFRTKSDSKKTLFTTMITTYGISDNQYSQQYVAQQVTMDALF